MPRLCWCYLAPSLFLLLLGFLDSCIFMHSPEPKRDVPVVWYTMSMSLQKNVAMGSKSQRMALPEGHFTLLEVMWRKDARTFFRDTAQWSQMLLVVALISMYVLNFSFIEKGSAGRNHQWDDPSFPQPYFKRLCDCGYVGPVCLSAHFTGG